MMPGFLDSWMPGFLDFSWILYMPLIPDNDGGSLLFFQSGQEIEGEP